jgi:hypothetical protein
MQRLATMVGMALISAMTAAKAEDAKPAATAPVAGPAADLTGTWNMRFPIVIRSPGGRPTRGVPVCVLQQAGNQLSGACRIADSGEGPVTGSVDGKHVELKWDFRFYPNMRARFSHADDDMFAITTFRGDLETDTALRGRYQSQFQQGWNRVFTADKQPG